MQNLVYFCVIVIFTHSAAAQIQADELAQSDWNADENSSGGNGSGTDSAYDDDTIYYCLDLHSGNNLISFYALPGDASISNVMASLLGNVTKVVGEGVAASYSDGWLGSLTTVSPRSGYWVTLNEDASLCLSEAHPTDPGIVYNLHAGNNLVSFPYHGTVDLRTALPDDVENAITGITGEGVAATKSDEHGWVGSLTAFQGGKGYSIATDKPVELVFNVPEPSGLLLLLTGIFVMSGLRRPAK